ncbi:MAG: LysE family translocator [Bacteroidales bacterium]|nr:LysE family translocator [Bacteroidales bacterium]
MLNFDEEINNGNFDPVKFLVFIDQITLSLFFTENFLVLCKGILIGFVESIPPGAIAVLCIQRTLCKSRRSGFVSGLGAATADTVYAVIAAFFLGIVLPFMDKYLAILKIVCGIGIMILGISIFRKNPVVQIKQNRSNKENLWSDYLSGFLVTLANPVLFLIFIALFAVLGVDQEGINSFQGAWLVGGVTIGAVFWWFLLTSGVAIFRKNFRPRYMLYLNWISGTLIVFLGLGIIISIVTDVL